MAIVFEQERELDLNQGKEINELGPGQYLPITIPKKITQNSAPFLSSSKKTKKKEEITPGPGEYYHDLSKEKFEKIKENAIIEIYEKKKLIDIQNKIISQDDPLTISQLQATIKLKKNFEKYGFLTKEKRWKEKEQNNFLGPGSFFDEKSIKSKKEIQNIIKKTKNKIIKNKQFQNRIDKIDSIPGKYNFGYDIGKNGELIKKENPNKYKIFSGEKGNSVGPGNYDIELPEQWKKTGTNWSKSKLNRSYDNKKKIHKINENINSVNCNMGNFRDKKNDNLFSDNNIIGNVNFFNISIYRTYALNQLLSKEKSLNKLFPKNNDKNLSYIPKSNSPGPGYYYNDNLFTLLNNLPKKKKLKDTFFGSKSERFGNGINSYKSSSNINLGPGQYFLNKHSDAFKKRHLKKFLLSHSIPFMSLTERFHFSQSSTNINSKDNNLSILKVKNQKENKIIQKNNSFDSITQSNSSKINNQNKQILMHGTLYSKEPRFKDNENKLKESSLNPGPGSYINPFSNTGISNTINYNGRFVDIRTGKNLILNNKRPKSSNNKYDYFIEKNSKFIPSVGKYNPGINLTIEYKNIKKMKEGRIDIGFNSSVPCDRDELYSFQKNDNLGPGKYFVNDNGIKNKNYGNAAFGSSSERGLIEDDVKLFKNNSMNDLGPENYNYNDNYSWVKKSFNVKYI